MNEQEWTDLLAFAEKHPERVKWSYELDGDHLVYTLSVQPLGYCESITTTVRFANDPTK